MVGNYIKYTCKNCGWQTRILKEWADLKPPRCMNKKCNTSFRKNPESLIVEHPVEPKKKSQASTKTSTKKVSKKKTSSKKTSDERQEEQTESSKDS